MIRMRKISAAMHGLYPLIIILILCSGCGRGKVVDVSWKKEHSEITKGSPVNYQGVSIGYVSQVKPRQQKEDGVITSLRLDKKYEDCVTEKTTFIIKTNSAGRAYLNTIVHDASAPPVKSGAILVGSEDNVEVLVGSVLLNWKRSGLFILIIMAAMVVPLLLLRLLMKIWALAICGVAGTASMLFLKPYIEPYLLPHLPADVAPELALNSISFLIGATICMLLLGALRFGKDNAR